MPQTLADVLHYFIPESAAAPPTPVPSGVTQRAVADGTATARLPVALARGARPAEASLPLVALPLGPRDVVRAAFVWNLGVELARLGASATILAPSRDAKSSLWPDAGPGPLGSELVLAHADDLATLARAGRGLVEAREREAPHAPSVVLARVPPAWLERPGDGAVLARRVLLFSSPDRRELLETYALVKRLVAVAPAARIGVTIHGVRSVAEARGAFHRLARAAERHLRRGLISYGLVADDLAVYRSVIARRPVSLSQPQSAAARSLGEVARLLLDDIAPDGPHDG